MRMHSKVLQRFAQMEEFTVIINPPQTAILSVGCLESAVLEREDFSVVTLHYITSTLSHDMRAISAELASRWLSEFTNIFENPLTDL